MEDTTEFKETPKTEEQVIHALALDLTALIKKFPTKEREEDEGGGTILRTEDVHLYGVGDLYILSARKPFVRGIGNGSIEFIVSNRQNPMLSLGLHVDAPTQSYVEEHYKDPLRQLGRFFTQYYFSDQGGIIKISQFPKEIPDERPDIYQGFKTGEVKRRDVESTIEESEYEMLGYILTHFKTELQRAI